MAKEWYEEDDNESVWWKAAKKNAHQACPVLFQQPIRFSENLAFVEAPFYLSTAFYAHKSIGMGAKVLSIVDKGTKLQRGVTTTLAAHSYCAGAFVGGMLDATWQINHEGMHFLTSTGEQAVEWWEDLSGWYESKEKGVARLLDGVYLSLIHI